LGNRGTVTEASGFKPEEDAQKIYGAMKGAGKWSAKSEPDFEMSIFTWSHFLLIWTKWKSSLCILN